MMALVWTWERMQNTGMVTESAFSARAMPWLDRIEALDAGNGALLGFRARFAAVRGERDDARQLYQRAVEAAPNDVSVRMLYAQFLRRGDIPGALAQVDRVLQLDPANSSVHVARAQILRSLHRYDEAVSAAKRAIELDPQQPNAYGALADIAHNTGDGAGQVVWHMQAHRIDPKDHEIPTKIATALATLGELAAADAWIDESLRIAPGHIYPESRRVDMAFLRGDYARARELGLSFAPREAEDVHDSWLFGLESACAAGRYRESAPARAQLGS
jgi:tetratricopeptide (TPR) repeat protein